MAIKTQTYLLPEFYNGDGRTYQYKLVLSQDAKTTSYTSLSWALYMTSDGTVETNHLAVGAVDMRGMSSGYYWTFSESLLNPSDWEPLVASQSGIKIYYINGARTVNFSFNVTDTSNGRSQTFSSGTVSFVCDPLGITKDTFGTIPALTMESTASIPINIGQSGTTHTLTASVGSLIINISSSSHLPIENWSIPDLSAQTPTSMTVPCTLTLKTYMGSSLVGTDKKTVSMSVASYSYSVASATLTRGSILPSVTAFVAGRTNISISLQTPPTGQKNASGTASWSMEDADGNILDSGTYSAATTFEKISQAAGVVYVKTWFTDSRGISSAKASASVTYVPNIAPTITMAAGRTNSSFLPDATGAYYSANASAVYSYASAGNRVTISISGTTGTDAGDGTASATKHDSLSVSLTLELTATVTDTLGNSVSCTAVVPVGYALMQAGGGTNHQGVSVGMVSTEDKFQCNIPAVFYQGAEGIVYKHLIHYTYIYEDSDVGVYSTGDFYVLTYNHQSTALTLAQACASTADAWGVADELAGDTYVPIKITHSSGNNYSVWCSQRGGAFSPSAATFEFPAASGGMWTITCTDTVTSI